MSTSPSSFSPLLRWWSESERIRRSTQRVREAGLESLLLPPQTAAPLQGAQQSPERPNPRPGTWQSPVGDQVFVGAIGLVWSNHPSKLPNAFRRPPGQDITRRPRSRALLSRVVRRHSDIPDAPWKSNDVSRKISRRDEILSRAFATSARTTKAFSAVLAARTRKGCQNAQA